MAGRSFAARAKIKGNFIDPGIINAKMRKTPTVRCLPEVSQIKNASKRLKSEKIKKSTPKDPSIKTKHRIIKDKNCKKIKKSAEFCGCSFVLNELLTVFLFFV